ncbi:MAG: ATP synthase F1 subunit delta [Planctomycetes bacterium]|nr:ATP synthase F1 subunit delta [Planctomycetota bacterium]
MDMELKTKIRSVYEDPRAQSIAKVYAIAYLDAAGQNSAAASEELASFVDDVLGMQSEFDQLLRGTSLGHEEKLRLIDRVVSGRATPLFTSFLKVLARHDRLSLLPGIQRLVEVESERRAGQRRVSVTSAAVLGSATLESIRAALRSTLSIEPILETRVDATLVGGLVVRVGDTVYDGSLKTQVKQLRARLRERCLNEIQRGRDRFSHPEGN